MSQSLASAKKRRAPVQSEPIPNPTSSTSQNQPGLTLPQVIHIIDQRLTALEQFTRNNKLSSQLSSQTYNDSSNDVPQEIPTNIKEVVEEFDKRYDMLAEEIVNLKNIVLSLQSYTMEVNKTLMEERGRIYDEIEKTQHNQENHDSNE
jgi:enamine deaminase RidA (YjgF/YER057c/UK114 family)